METQSVTTRSPRRCAAAGRYASILDAIRADFRAEWRVLRPSWSRSVLLVAAVPCMSFLAGLPNPWDKFWALVYGAPIALFVLLGWSDERFPI